MSEKDPADRHPVWRELDELTRHKLIKAVRQPLDDEGRFMAEAWVGSCIYCGSSNTMDLFDVEGIENAAVGLCRDCCGLFCTECRAPIETPDLMCGHFAICEECGLCDYSEVGPDECLEEDFASAEGEGEELFEELDELDLDDLYDLDEMDDRIDPLDCELIRTWLIEKGYYTREELEEYDRLQEDDIFMDEALVCGWCKKPFELDGTIYTNRLELKPGLELEGEEGLVVPLHLTSVDRVVPAVFFTMTMPGGEMSRGLSVFTCSLECLEALRDAFNREREIIERFNVN